MRLVHVPQWEEEGIFRVLDDKLNDLTKDSGLPFDRVRLLVCMFSCLVLAQIQWMFLNRLSPSFKHAFNLVFGSFFMYWCFRLDSVVLLFTVSVVYLLVLVFPRKTARKIGLPFVLLMMSLSHLYTMLLDWGSYVLDFTGPQMVITIKLYCFLIQLVDAEELSENLAKSQYIQEAKLKKVPSVLEYLGWIFFYPSVLILSCDFAHYKQFIESSPEDFGPGRTKKFFYTLGVTFLCLVVGFAIGPAYFSDDFVRSDAWLEETSFFYRCFYMMFCFGCIRFKYYFAWKLTECSFILCGYSYYKGEWTRGNNMDIWEFETSENYFGALNAWNIAAAQWLKYYVYMRAKSWPVLCANLASAVWHGFYPGFYLAFITAGMFREIGNILRKKLRPLFFQPDGAPKATKFFYDRTCHIFTLISITYAFSVFVIYDVTGPNSSFRLLGSLYYIGHILFVPFFIFGKMLPTPKMKKKE